MSSYYLIDLHTNPFTNSPILDVSESVTGSSPMNGGTIVRVSDYVGVKDPANVGELLTQKFAGLLAYYAGFSYVTYDDLLDATGVDTGAASLKGSFGDRGCIKLPPSTGLFHSTLATLSGVAPSQAIITWEVYEVLLADPSTGRGGLTYVERPASSLTCVVSFDNGAHFYATTDGAVLNIPVGGQGIDFRIRLTNTSSDQLYVGAWAVVY